MKVAISNDKFGFRLKEAVVKKLRGDGHEVIDYGTKDPDEPKAHSQAGSEVARAIQSGEAERGILFCGTGMGVSLTANKFKGVYAAVCESVFSAQHCRLINDCNVLCLGVYILGEYMTLQMAETFINTGFAENFEETRKNNLKKQIDRIAEIEAENFK
ncbi:MAG: Ribose-5-phosphate isomerase B [Desulfovibrio sp.]|uniref:RpiB/LacA/LacB family sugar-phosphate isomerase n=1 Tax=Christensenella intestinihominis TaxID=1851429 RepID=UPI0009F6B6C9|nr:RpiB/LacA/LacB family sugar-phosphate isomerase [Christensenella intestinihominis]